MYINVLKLHIYMDCDHFRYLCVFSLTYHMYLIFVLCHNTQFISFIHNVKPHQPVKKRHRVVFSIYIFFFNSKLSYHFNSGLNKQWLILFLIEVYVYKFNYSRKNYVPKYNNVKIHTKIFLKNPKVFIKYQ